MKGRLCLRKELRLDPVETQTMSLSHQEIGSDLVSWRLDCSGTRKVARTANWEAVAMILVWDGEEELDLGWSESTGLRRGRCESGGGKRD